MANWINNADDYVIKASHWQIMLEPPTFRPVHAYQALARRHLNATGEHVMMQSAIPKQRVLIVGAKFGEMYLNAFMQPGGWNWLAFCPREARDRESWLMPLESRCIPRRSR
jgi:hypothetical protein